MLRELPATRFVVDGELVIEMDGRLAFDAKGAEMTSAASEQAKTAATELESMARRNPLGAIAGAVLIGVLVGMLGRRN